MIYLFSSACGCCRLCLRLVGELDCGFPVVDCGCLGLLVGLWLVGLWCRLRIVVSFLVFVFGGL